MNRDKTLYLVSIYNGRCAYCSKKIKYYQDCTADHIIPKSNFKRIIETNSQPHFLKHLGINDINHIDNLLPSCRRCNQIKGNLELEQFRWLFFGEDRKFYFEIIRD